MCIDPSKPCEAAQQFTVRYHNIAHKDYDKALRQSLWSRVNRSIRHKQHDLIAFSEVWPHVKNGTRTQRGVMDVELNAIVGSSGRVRDFDAHFLPRRREYHDRWVNVMQAHYEGITLAPIVLYKVGGTYFVEDGNHRVSVARMLGQDSIAAQVIDIDPASESIFQRFGAIIESS
jgi:hypothetical protein